MENNEESDNILEVVHETKIQTFSECVSLAWSNTTDKYLVVGCKDANIYVFNVSDGSVYLKVNPQTKSIQQALFTPDDSRVIAVGTDQKLCVVSMLTKWAEDQGTSVKFFNDLAILQPIAEDGSVQ